MTEILRPDNHDLWRRVQHLVALRWSWEAIATDAGVMKAKDLVQWVNDYKSPRKAQPLIRPAQMNNPVPRKLSTSSSSTAQFMAWRRQRDGATKTRAENA